MVIRIFIAFCAFESTWFHVFRGGKGRFRVHSKKLIAKGWHINVDVKVMSSLGGALARASPVLNSPTSCKMCKGQKRALDIIRRIICVARRTHKMRKTLKVPKREEIDYERD